MAPDGTDDPPRLRTVRTDARFVGAGTDLRQVVEVVVDTTRPVVVHLRGRGVGAQAVPIDPGPAGRRVHAELAADLGGDPDESVAVEVEAIDDRGASDRWTGDLVVARPGTTIHLVPHFHFDAVWWNTQAASVSELARSDWSGSPRMGFQRSAFDILAAHLDRARTDARYRFCVAEMDYLRPYLERHPWDRATLADLVAAGRVEVVGATTNEPATTLTSLELTRRNLVQGLAFQRGALGAPVSTAWQLDTFGHHPSFPSVLAEAGVPAAAWARGPYRQWGPMLDHGFDAPRSPAPLSLASEFEWIAPDGTSVDAAYLAAHYSSGWSIDGAETWQDAARLTVELGDRLRRVSLTGHVLVLVGTDLSPPPRWVTELPRRLAERYTWPRVEVSLPARFGAAVRAESARTGRAPAPTTRDMNPVYPGTAVSYIDTKQAAAAGEELVGEAETWAVTAAVLGAGPVPEDELDHAWRLLTYGAHHDAVTGTESDQVYLDLLAGWRRAHDLGRSVLERSVGAVADLTDTRGPGPAVVVAGCGGSGRDVVTVEIGSDDLAGLATRGLRIVDDAGLDIAFVADHVVRHPDATLRTAALTLVVERGPGAVHTRVLHLVASPDLPRWERRVVDGPVRVGNGYHVVTVDPARGGAVTEWHHLGTGRHLVADGDLGGELLLYPEHPTHPVHGEGPWHLAPSGPPRRSSEHAAEVVVERSPVGERVVTRGRVDDLTHRTTLSLWRGVDRVDVAVTVDHHAGADHLLRIRWPSGLAGARPVAEVGEAVIGRSVATVDLDAADGTPTLDGSAPGWIAASSTARVVLADAHGRPCGERAVGVAEVVVDDEAGRTDHGRRLVVALAAAGVSSTCTLADECRYGDLGLDSNLPDVRLVAGLVDADGSGGAVGRVLADRPAERDHVRAELATSGRCRVWVPAAGPSRPTPTDVTAIDALPVVVVSATDAVRLGEEVAAAVAELTGARLGATLIAEADPVEASADLADATVAVVHRGTPGVAVTADGAIHLSLLRACTAWPAGQWIDPPQRTTPDGSSFQLQHWTHRFDHAVVVGPGDWRRAGVAAHATALRRPLHAAVRPPRDGTVPAGPLVTVAPASVELVALKATGYPLLTGRRDRTRRTGQVTARLHEAWGRATTARLRLPRPVGGARDGDLLEQVEGTALTVREGEVEVPLGARGSATVLTDVDVDIDERDAAPVASAVIPSPQGPPPPPHFARYWVQGRGPAPRGGLPVSVHLHPPEAPGGDRPWTVVVGSWLDHPVAVRLTHEVAPGWTVAGGTDDVLLGPGEHHVSTVSMTPPTPTGGGTEIVRTTARVVGLPAMTVYDEHLVGPDGRPGGPGSSLTGPGPGLRLTAGDSGFLHATLTNLTTSTRRAEVEVLGPWGTWPMTPLAELALDLGPAATTSFRVPVTVAATAEPGWWWLSLRAVVGPEVHHGTPVGLEVLAGRGPEAVACSEHRRPAPGAP